MPGLRCYGLTLMPRRRVAGVILCRQLPAVVVIAAEVAALDRAVSLAAPGSGVH